MYPKFLRKVLTLFKNYVKNLYLYIKYFIGFQQWISKIINKILISALLDTESKYALWKADIFTTIHNCLKKDYLFTNSI